MPSSRPSALAEDRSAESRPVTDADCVAFLQWALPRLRLRWSGFRRVRRQVCKRVGRRLRELGLPDTKAYRRYLEAHGDEWRRLDALCRISISRFCRDRAVFDRLREVVLPSVACLARARGEGELHAWCAGCASGEEAYTLRILWELGLASRFPGLALRLTASDADERLLERARRGRFGASSLKDVPTCWLETAFEREHGLQRVRAELCEAIDFRREDLRERMPEGPFHLVLCRNLVFTYFEAALQEEILARIAERLLPDGALLVGARECLPGSGAGFVDWVAPLGIYRRREAEASA